MRRKAWSTPSWASNARLALLLLALLAACRAAKPDTELCPLHEYIDDNDETVQEFFECPGLEDPPNHRLCCGEKCCPMLDSVLQLDIRIAMVISLTVICACVLSGVVIVVCCFASSCPMYDTCAGSWGDHHHVSFANVGGYIPSDMHPLTLNGSKEQLEKNHRLADGIPPIRISEADHV